MRLNVIKMAENILLDNQAISPGPGSRDEFMAENHNCRNDAGYRGLPAAALTPGIRKAGARTA
jgi:hypothetical protein